MTAACLLFVIEAVTITRMPVNRKRRRMSRAEHTIAQGQVFKLEWLQQWVHTKPFGTEHKKVAAHEAGLRRRLSAVAIAARLSP